MRLTHIKLAGFKSFVDPTTITVPGKLVAVIGPNGCGKSNVIDAVRWVLGEASAKQLRGESMQDVIFNGATSRRPATRASVELIFDNSEGKLNSIWGQYHTIAIKRQLTRQGDSSYYINNQLVRRRDITDLFLGTGVGARGYAVIEQGMISRIIEARPEELRTYIEEAAGISKYKERRRETENRLSQSREHLQRLADLQAELDRQVEKLQRQAQTAAQYQTLNTQLTYQQNLRNYSQWQQALSKADQATAQYQAYQLELDTIQQHIQQQQDTLQQLREQEQNKQQQWRDSEHQHALLREQWVRMEEQLRHQRDWYQRLKQEETQIHQRLAQLQQTAQQQLEALTQAQSEIEEQLLIREEWALQIEDDETQRPQLETALQQHVQTTHHQQSELTRLERELAVQQQKQQYIQQNLTQLQQRQTRLQHEQRELNLPTEIEIAQAQQKVSQQQQALEQLQTSQKHNEQHYQHARQQLQQLQQQHQQLQTQELTLTAQIEALAALLPQQHRTDFWTQVQADNLPVLWQHLEVNPHWQHAVSVVLGQRLQARCGQFSLPAPLPEGTAIWVNQPPQIQPTTPTTATLLQHIQTTAPFAPAVQFWLQSVFCANTLHEALAQQPSLQTGQMIITPEGHWVDAISVHLFNQDQNEHLLQRQQQLRQHQQALNELAQPLQQSQIALDKAHQQIHHMEASQQQTQQAIRQQQQQLQVLHTEANQLLTRVNQGQIRQEHIEQELQSIQQEISTLTEQQTHTDIETLIPAIDELQQQLQLSQQQQQMQQQQLKQLQLHLLEAQRQQGLADVAYMRCQQKIDRARQERQRIADDISRAKDEQQELAQQLLQQPQDEEQQTQAELLNQQLEELQTQCQQAQEALHTTQTALQQTQQQQQSLNAQLPALQEATQQTLLQQQEALLQARNHHEVLVQNQADLEHLATEWHPDINLSELNQTITSLTKKINALGAVNLAALAELAEADTRAQYYQQQTTDIQSAIDLLEQAISQIDDDTKNRFKTTFDAVNEKVQSYFPILFGGGQAQLQMVGDNLLDAGIAIMAHPPGKKNSTIHLLSGGEKALTAMSLVFALFSLNPAPFCLLDEVDAPLDDANTSRFCQLVQQMSAQTQFLYISHNRLTMEMAEQLVGVTMQEKGVSRIVAVNIQQALDMAQ